MVTSPALNPTNATFSNVAAPAGSKWSEVAGTSSNANAFAGLSGQSLATGPYRFADDFIVPAGQSWHISAVIVYAYQPGATLAPFNAANMAGPAVNRVKSAASPAFLNMS